MKTNKKDTLIVSLLSIVIGVLFIIYKGGILNYIMTVLGIILIIVGVLHLVKDKDKVYGAVLLVLGILMIVSGWFIIEIVLYVLAVLLILYGIIGLLGGKKKNALGIIGPLLMIAAGVLLFLNKAIAIDYFFIIEGVILIVEGLLNLVTSSTK